MTRPNTQGWELAARKYCNNVGINPDEHEYENNGMLQPNWRNVADELYIHYHRNLALGITNNPIPVVHA